MNLVDSSIWIDYFRGMPTAARDTLRSMLADGDEVFITEPIIMELLAGAPDFSAARRLETLVNGLSLLTVEPDLDYRDAASIYRNVRRSGRTVRKMNDCLIAAVALRTGATVVHKDIDFEMIGEVVPLVHRSLR